MTIAGNFSDLLRALGAEAHALHLSKLDAERGLGDVSIDWVALRPVLVYAAKCVYWWRKCYALGSRFES